MPYPTVYSFVVFMKILSYGTVVRAPPLYRLRCKIPCETAKDRLLCSHPIVAILRTVISGDDAFPLFLLFCVGFPRQLFLLELFSELWLVF